MPKASSSTQSSTTGVQQAANLGRHQACHRCRRKKLKCDAKMPCGTCVRSHSFAIRHHGTSEFRTLQCVYDDPEDVVDTLKTRILKLETRIEQLEEILQNNEAEMLLCTCGRGSRATSEGTSGSIIPHTVMTVRPTSASISSSSTTTDPGLLVTTPSKRTDGEPAASLSLYRPPDELGASMTYGASGPHEMPMLTDFDPFNFKLGNFLWPINLPPPDVLHHLVETFFASVPLATRLIHRPTFMASLQQPPTSVEFPQVSILHAICALASLYTPIDKDQYPLDNKLGAGQFRFFHSGVLPTREDHETGFEQGIQYTPMRLEDVTMHPKMSFGAMHLRWAATAFKFAIYFADRLVQAIQSAVVCAWYNYSMGLHLNLYGWFSALNGAMLPLGFNVSPGSEPLSRLKSNSTMLLPGPYKRPMREVPRNVYWIAFAMERVYAAPTVWPLASSEDDSCQTMPVCLDDFLNLRGVPSDDRQTLHTPGFFTDHPAGHTDGFSLYIKGAVLLGKVKTFNGRFRVKHGVKGASIDPRETMDFRVLDNKILGFVANLPREFKDPVTFCGAARLDPVLYLAHLLPYTATILLHDPHANFSSPNCPSAGKLLSAARSILEMIYNICATSYDLIYLDHACGTCWLLAGVVLVRSLKAAKRLGYVQDVGRLRNEIEAVRFILTNFSKRTVVGGRQLELLDDFYGSEVGERPLEQVTVSHEPLVEDIIVLE